MAFVKKLYEPGSREPFRISRTKIDLYAECQRCFYLDVRLGVKRPSGPAFTLNNAVDELLKREFDIHRGEKSAHPLMKRYGVDAAPLSDERLEEWRDARRRGITYLDRDTNLLITGGIDDVWENQDGEFLIVDYKATSKKDAPILETDLYPSYKRQVEVYQWLFRKNGFKVSSTAYFVYVNGRADAEAFDGKLEFDVALIPYKGDDSWVSGTIQDIKRTLESESIPPVGKSFGGGRCEYCQYREDAGRIMQKFVAPKTGWISTRKKKNNEQEKKLFI